MVCLLVLSPQVQLHLRAAQTTPLPPQDTACSSYLRRVQVPSATLQFPKVLRMGLPLQDSPPSPTLNVAASPTQPISSCQKGTSPPNSRFLFRSARRPRTPWSPSSRPTVYAGVSTSAILTDTARSCVVPYLSTSSTIASWTKQNLRRSTRDGCSLVGPKRQKSTTPIWSSRATHRTPATESRTCTYPTRPSCASRIRGYIRASARCNSTRTKMGDTAARSRREPTRP